MRGGLDIGVDHNSTDYSSDHSSTLTLLDYSLRFCVIPLSVATIWLSVTNKEDNNNYGNLEYTNLMGLKYMVCISALCVGYTFIVVICSWIKCLVTKTWIFFISDQIGAYLMVTSGGVVFEILYLAYNGDQAVTWSESCSIYGRFCSKMKVALVLHGLALCCFIVLAVISGFKVFSMFDPPSLSSSEEEEDKN